MLLRNSGDIFIWGFPCPLRASLGNGKSSK